MATDRYSDDHTISVSSGSGTLTIEGSLVVNGSQDVNSTGSVDISAGNDINLTATDDIKLLANDLLDLRGENLQVLVSNFASVTTGGSATLSISNTLTANANEVVVSAGDIGLSASADLNLSADNDVNIEAIGNDVTITANQLNIELTGSPERIIINNNTSSCDIRFDHDTSATIAIPASAFQVVNTGDGENTGLSLYLNGGSGNYQAFYAPLPDSIPNGSTIATVGLRYNNTSSDDGYATISIRSLDYQTTNSYSTLDSNDFTLTASTTEYLTSSFLANINKSRAIQVSVVLTGSANLAVFCIVLSYQTDRININQ